MLRTSKSAVKPPVFTCAFCSSRLAHLLPIRRLHSSNKANDYETAPQPRSEPRRVALSNFQSFRKNPSVAEAASKWNIPGPIAGAGGGGDYLNNRDNPPSTRRINSSPQTPRLAPRDGWKGSAITRPGDEQDRHSLSRFGQRFEPQAMPSVGRSKQGATSDLSRFLPPLGHNDKRASKDLPRFGGTGRKTDRDMPGFLPPLGQTNRGSSRDMPMPPFRRENRQTGGTGRGLVPRFGRDEQHGGERRERTARDFLPRFDRKGSERIERTSRELRQEPGRYNDRNTRKEAEVPSTPEFAASETDSPVQTRVRDFDQSYNKRQAAKFKDRGRSHRRFDDNESAILDESVLSAKETKKAKKAAKRAPKKELIPIFLPQFISVENLAAVLNVRVEKFTQQLVEMGFEQTSHDHVLGAEEAGLIAGEYGFEPVIDRGHEVDLKPRPAPEDKSILPERPPVVTIMGHVDHGKTTLLDWLRKSSIVDSEHGGITQHIGAFSVTMPSGKVITFLDTPGHAAFLSMRERGASVTDIVILVIAADDSVKPQTLEAIKHAKAAGVPMIVAINKVDKQGADVQKVIGDLVRYEVEVEDLGGDVQTVPVSGKTGQGMEQLEEAVVALGEMLNHRSETDGQVEGWVLEATTKKKGRVATVLVTRGTLKPGVIVVAGNTWTKVRSMTNEHGEIVPVALPGTPVEIDGWREQPNAGDLAISAETEDRAKQAVEYRVEKSERIKQAADMEAINESRKAARAQEEYEDEIRRAAEARGEDPEKAVADASKTARANLPSKIKEVGFIVKADVSGSVEAIVDSISSLGNHEVKSKVIRSSFGAISEFDIDHASAAGAYVLAFNLPSDPQIYQYARAKNVTIIAHNVIYHLVDNVIEKLEGFLPPKITTTVTGEAEIIQIFNLKVKGSKKPKPVAGCRVKTGIIQRNKKIRVVRNKEIVFDGTLESLKNVQKNVDEMKKDSDCGIAFTGWSAFKEGDVAQCYEAHEEKRKLQQ